jgi:hypothetical protein
MCPNQTGEGCFRPIHKWAENVQDIKKRLLEEKGVKVERVVMTSDEKDPAWWEEVRAQGWHFADHKVEATKEKYGPW